MRTVGLTGNIASGKSTVARWLRDDHGLPVIDADEVARAVVEPGSSVLAAIVQRFGPRALGADGRLDRPALGAIIRSDPQARSDLEALTHPAITAHIQGWLAEQADTGAPAAVVEASLLVETGQERRYDLLLVVTCGPETQVQRLMATRDMDEPTARAWLRTQLPAARKEALADVVIHNDGTPDQLRAAVRAALPRILAEPRR